MHTVIFKYHSTHTHTHSHRKTFSINHAVLWPDLLNANIMDLSDKPLPFSLSACLVKSGRREKDGGRERGGGGERL